MKKDKIFRKSSRREEDRVTRRAIRATTINLRTGTKPLTNIGIAIRIGMIDKEGTRNTDPNDACMFRTIKYSQ